MSENRLALLDKAQSGDSDACGKMVEENSGLIWAVVRRYYGCGADPEDLYQLGCIGFIKAVKGFDITYGTQFSTYAVPKIAGEIRRFLRDDGPVKVGRTLREKGQSVWSARQRLRAALGREPKLSELAAETGWSAEEIATAELATAAPEESLVEKIALREAIRDLPERERETIYLRFFKCMTQEQAARVLGVSQVQVSRLERKGVAHLREMLRE